LSIEDEVLEVRREYPYLIFQKKAKEYILYGTIFIRNNDIKDKYELEISIPGDYPKEIPTVKEVEGKIPKNFHCNRDSTLCLETPLKIYKTFRKCETLKNFIDKLIVPYLYSFSYYKKHDGNLPYGEHKHGAEGILDDYKIEFGVNKNFKALKLLQILAEDYYRGHHLCPCGSGKKLRNCHIKNILLIKELKFDYVKDFKNILNWLKNKKNFDIRPFLSKKLSKIINKI
jgi:hypothetical protein